jgi:ketosteroid isomerase-like protein
MKNTFAALLLVVGLGASLVAQRSAGPSDALQAIEQKWARALETGDAAALDSILASTYVDTDDEGHQTDKAALLSAVKSKDLKLTSLTVSNMKVYPYGDAAVVTGRALQKGTYKGQPLAVPVVVFTDTFVSQNGNWRAVASHRSPVK